LACAPRARTTSPPATPYAVASTATIAVASCRARSPRARRASSSGPIGSRGTIGYGWHAVAEGNEDLQALIASAETFVSLGILVPSRNATLLGWCLDNGLRLVQQSTLMTVGLYNEPQGAWLPSIVY
jgi:hypothetical protein